MTSTYRFALSAAVLAGLAAAVLHCGDSATAFSDSGGSSGGGTNFDAGSSRDAAGTCSQVDYAFTQTCDVDAGARSNTQACKTSFDCAGICCACPAKTPVDAGEDGGDAAAPATADAGDGGDASVRGPGFQAYACACGQCVIDTAMCTRMLAGDPSLCP